ncbi:dicarboxylate/amino acid:cation symporter [Emcibacter sp. SYSU 3D8]|uniref:dicarboxylate/amino acid:cation symporter n=1 Tax=Emcibacter sp. SYSU 3D8 TaxID=3133969 RepID=UPI0031FE7C11
MGHKHAKIILYAIATGVVLGALLGWFSPAAGMSLKWMGDLFLTMLKMLIVPLIFAAVLSGVTALGDIRKLGRIGGLTVGYFLVTTCIAVVIGLIVVNVIQPGVGIALGDGTIPEQVASKADMGPTDILFQIVQPNLVDAAAKTNLLPLILFALLLGAALTTVGRRGAHVIEFFDGINEAMMKLVVWLMYLAPLGIFALVAARLGTAQLHGGFLAEVGAVGLHVLTVLSALSIHFVVLLLILFFVAGRGWRYLAGLLRALLTAFGTASSSATMPLTLECARQEGVDPRAVRFVIPLGTTVNMNGTALYEACAAMFIAQAYGVPLGLEHQVIIVITATLAAIGAAGIPEAGLVTMVIVLNAVGLPLEGIGLLLTVDWFLDRFRTSVNVWGDAVGAAVVGRYLPDVVDDPALEGDKL